MGRDVVELMSGEVRLTAAHYGLVGTVHRVELLLRMENLLGRRESGSVVVDSVLELLVLLFRPSHSDTSGKQASVCQRINFKYTRWTVCGNSNARMGLMKTRVSQVSEQSGSRRSTAHILESLRVNDYSTLGKGLASTSLENAARHILDA